MLGVLPNSNPQCEGIHVAVEYRRYASIIYQIPKKMPYLRGKQAYDGSLYFLMMGIGTSAFFYLLHRHGHTLLSVSGEIDFN